MAPHSGHASADAIPMTLQSTAANSATRARSMRIQLVVNPESGAYSPALIARLRSALERHGAEVSLGESSPRQALHLAPEVDRLVVVGGDGTVRHVAAALQASERRLPFVAYPGGTVNLMQLETGAPRDIDAFAALATSPGPARAHYPARLNQTLFLACASVGPDSAAVAALSPALKRWLGRMAYAIAFLAVMWRWSLPRLRVDIDGTAQECDAVYIAKGRYFAGPWSFAPAARMDAPDLHVVCVDAPTRLSYLRFLLALALHRPLARLAGVRCLTCRSLRIDASNGAALPLQADGDIATTLPAQIGSDLPPLPVLR